MHSRHPSWPNERADRQHPNWRQCAKARRLAVLAAALLCASPNVSRAQRADTSRVARPAAGAVKDPFAPPLTPRRAFFYSFLAPGYSQSVMGRNKAATGFLLFE